MAQNELDNFSELRASAPPRPSGTALDIGCGTGFGYRLIKGNETYIGLDSCPCMLKRMPRTISCSKVVATATSLPFKEACCACILACGLLEYIPHLDPFFIGCRHVIQPKGVLLASSSPPGICSELRRLTGHRLFLRKRAEVIDTAGRSGWKLHGCRRTLLQDQYLFIAGNSATPLS